ncbi:hypothetical protein CUMW_264620 [Citrus unshiu]|uniref:Uncharacterized protein n=2 Tax=Citrus TaxID=2706 RepID=A0A067DJ95_CITSI|nr:hypothetical protein CISIN_1g037909mg [Citrus sinensis]GAY68503.1 hypothetical protein CUMW_264620 [Citrus unshiu]
MKKPPTAARAATAGTLRLAAPPWAGAGAGVAAVGVAASSVVSGTGGELSSAFGAGEGVDSESSLFDDDDGALAGAFDETFGEGAGASESGASA